MPNPKANGGSLADDEGDLPGGASGPRQFGSVNSSLSRSITSELRQGALGGVMGKLVSNRKVRNRAQEEMNNWTTGRQTIQAILTSNAFDLVIGLAIAFNLAILLVEIDQRAGCYPKTCETTTITAMNRFLLGVYTVEAGMRMYVQRLKYHKDGWNILDLSLVVSGYFDEVMSALGDGGGALAILPILRIFRVARFLRGIRLLRFFPELYVMIRGFFFAMKAMAWGLMLIICLIMLWSALFIEVLNPLNRQMLAEQRATGTEVNEFCEDIFGSLLNSSIFFFQTLVAGDSWGSCAIPLIFYTNWTFFPFAMALVSVSLGLMNLILAIIVDQANQARENDKEAMLKRKKQHKEEAIEKWKSVIQLFDENQDGLISYEEMMTGYEVKEIRDVLEVMGIERDDLQLMFQLMDEDDSGDLQYDEFISSFLKAQGQEPMVYWMMMKLQISKMLKMTCRVSERLEKHELAAAGRGDGTPSGPMPNDVKGVPEEKQVEQPSPRNGQLKDATRVPSSLAPQLMEDFKLFSACLQGQFEALAHRLELNTATLQQCSQDLQAAGRPADGRLQAATGLPRASASFEKAYGGTAASPSLGRSGHSAAGAEPLGVAASPAGFGRGASQGGTEPLRAPHRPPNPALV